jgi:hypothetical protein
MGDTGDRRAGCVVFAAADDALTARRRRTMSIVSDSGAIAPEKSSRQGSASGRGFVVVTTPFVPGTPGVSAAE